MKSTKFMPLTLLIISVILMVFGQVMAKYGSENISVFNLLIWVSYSALIIRGILWIIILKKLPLSVAYPFLSISYILILVVSHFLFQESITANKIIGTVLIGFGIIINFLPKESHS